MVLQADYKELMSSFSGARPVVWFDDVVATIENSYKSLSKAQLQQIKVAEKLEVSGAILSLCLLFCFKQKLEYKDSS